MIEFFVRKQIVFFVVPFIVSLSVFASGQDMEPRPDFSGEWVLDNSDRNSDGVPEYIKKEYQAAGLKRIDRRFLLIVLKSSELTITEKTVAEVFDKQGRLTARTESVSKPRTIFIDDKWRPLPPFSNVPKNSMIRDENRRIKTRWVGSELLSSLEIDSDMMINRNSNDVHASLANRHKRRMIQFQDTAYSLSKDGKELEVAVTTWTQGAEIRTAISKAKSIYRKVE